MNTTDECSMQSEVIFFQENVLVKLPGPLNEEAAFTGKLMIIKEFHGHVIEWHPVQPVTPTIARTSPEVENLDWVEVAPAVGYKVNNGNEKDSVEIKSAIRAARPVVFDVLELKFFRRIDSVTNKSGSMIVLTFSLKDGTSIPSLHFGTIADYSHFMNTLETLVSIKRSKNDKTLYLIYDPNSEALEKSFSELELFDHTKPHYKFLKDPYETAMGGFSKVTNFLFDFVLYPNATGSIADYNEGKMAEMLCQSLPTVDIDHQEETGFEIITCVQKPPRLVITREEPMTPEVWNSYVDSEGRLSNIDELKRKIFKGGLQHSLRPEAWKFLLGYYSFYSSARDREAKRKQKVDDYYRMKLQWKSLDNDQESRFSALRERKSLIEKDVNRTDRTHPFYEGENNINLQMLYDILMTYCMYNFDLGYVQGMSDLLSPILVVIQSEPDAFWCFSSWMEKIGINFEMDQQGMKTQLQNLNRLLHCVDSQLCSHLETHDSGNMFFAFRWLLILFKRDFKYSEIMRLWEVLWTDLPCKNFHLLICIAILDTEKSVIMDNNYGLTEILKHINDMAYKINLENTLCKAEAIFQQIRDSRPVSDVVYTMLGLEMPPEPPKPAIPQSSSTPHVQYSGRLKNASPSNNSNNSADGIDGFVDLDNQISFNLFS